MSNHKSDVDYSLYLVTDSTEAILGNRDLISIVKAAVEGGVTIVQLRDKTSETAKLIDVARKLHLITIKYKLPLIINDRVDVAFAVGAEGVHLGQDDIDISTARSILGSKAIIGVTVSTPEEAISAAKLGASYLGIGTVYSTMTKEDCKSIIGIPGIREILTSLRDGGYGNLPTVCIGGINPSNLQRTIYQSQSGTKKLDGIAVVSAIIASEAPQLRAKALLDLFKTPPPFVTPTDHHSRDPRLLLKDIPYLLANMAQHKPLNHNMTNQVVQNFAANIALAIGSSPIMSQNALEASDLASLGGSLVINMGTITKETLHGYIIASQSYNSAGNPVLFDPVGAGATSERRNAFKELMGHAYFDVIKGNESEIQTLLGEEKVISQHGVDSNDSSLSPRDKARMVKMLALRERNVVLMTGEIDFLSDGARTYSIHNGHEYLGNITGSGCSLGTTIAAFLSTGRKDKLQAVMAAVLVFEIAAEIAARREDVKGPGTFVPALIDELFSIRQKTISGQADWIDMGKVSLMNV